MRHTSFFPPLKHLHNLIFTQSLSVIANTDLQARVRFFFSGARIFMNVFTFEELPFGTGSEVIYYKYTKDCCVDQDILATLVTL